MLTTLDKRTVKELQAILAKAAAFEKKGMWAEAARTYRFFLLKYPEHTAYHKYAAVLTELKSYDEAILHYENAIALKPDDAVAYMNIGNLYQEKGEVEKSLEPYGKAIFYNPMAAQVYYNRGIALETLGRHDEAIADFERTLALQPDFVKAYINMGTILANSYRFAEAIKRFDRAIELNPLLAEAYFNRSRAFLDLQKHHEALADLDCALALNPQYPQAHLNKSVVLMELKRKAEAAAIYERILHAEPEHVDANWNLSQLKLSEGEYLTGWKLFESRLKFQPILFNNALQRPYWRGQEEIADKTLLVHWEQGYGDMLQFCRYALLAKNAGAKVILAVQNPVKRLIESLDSGITVMGEDAVLEHYDYYCYLMSLPHAFATTVEAVPCPAKYLRTHPADRAAWKARTDRISGFKVGLVWAGGFRPRLRRNDANRSITLSHYAPLLDVPNTVFFSLQKGPPAAQRAAEPCGAAIVDWTEELGDFADTGALIENLDLVITVDTAVAHVAAALGKPVWIVIPYISCWRWLENRTDSPWYAGVRLFRQSKIGDWGPVIEAVRQELTAVAGAEEV